MVDKKAKNTTQSYTRDEAFHWNYASIQPKYQIVGYTFMTVRIRNAIR